MTIWAWIIFLAGIIGLLALDLGVFHRRSHAISSTQALMWTGFWVICALLFSLVVYGMYEFHWFENPGSAARSLDGKQAVILYLTGYLVEESLSLDNIFVMAMIFDFFLVPAAYRHRTLYWGILGAIIMRGIMIFAGVALINRFSWMIYIFAVILLVGAVKMLRSDDRKVEPDRNIFVRAARKLFPVSPTYHESRFFVRLDGKLMATPMFLVLLAIESTDVVFATDSIPAIFSITRDPFIIYTSNIFAILGLRSLYFALAGMMERFTYLKFSLSFILAFVAVKMITADWFHIQAVWSFGVISGALLVGIVISILATRRQNNNNVTES